MWKVYTTISEGTVSGTKGSKLGLLAKTVDAIARNQTLRPRWSVSHVASGYSLAPWETWELGPGSRLLERSRLGRSYLLRTLAQM